MDQVHTRSCSMAEEAPFNVRQLERLAQQWVVIKTENLADREIARRAPVGVHLP